ncbi:MAG: hypothetical protein ACHQQQ_05840 [Bacteroidota bacterium]
MKIFFTNIVATESKIPLFQTIIGMMVKKRLISDDRAPPQTHLPPRLYN